MRGLFLGVMVCLSAICNAQTTKTKKSDKNDQGQPAQVQGQPAPAGSNRIIKIPAQPGGKETALKQYFLVMLEKGPLRTMISDKALIQKMEESHLDNMQTMNKTGKLILAGPFNDDSRLKELFIFDCDTQAEVEELLSNDLMVKNGWLTYEIHPWLTGMNSVFH